MNKPPMGELLIRRSEAEDYPKIREFLLESSYLYPDIDKWCATRVKEAVKQDKRVVLVVDSGNSIEGLFIGKPGVSAKICTLRLRESARNQGVGRALVTQGLSCLLENDPSRFHLTISEAAEEGCVPFFESVGFRQIAVERNRYRTGVDEFIYSCAKNDILESVRNELSLGVEQTLLGTVPLRMPHEQTLLMSLKPQFAKLMLEGRKTIEFRRKFSKKYEGATIVFYITKPVGEFMLTAKITQVDHRRRSELWSDYQLEGGISQSIFDRYFSGTTHGYAIILADIKEVPNRLVLKRAKEIDPQLRPPQSFQKLDPESPLIRALSLPVYL